MSKLTLTVFSLLSLLFLGNSSRNYAADSATASAAKTQFKQTTPESQPARSSLDERGTGTLQKMIVENGSVSMNLDLNRLTSQGLPGSLVARPVTLGFVAGANSFFPILVFNDLLRGGPARNDGPDPGRGRLCRGSSVGCAQLGFAGDTPAATEHARSASRVAQPAGRRKSPFRSRIRSCCARRQYRIHLFQCSGTPIRLRSRGEVAFYYCRPASHFKGVCQCDGQAVGCGLGSRNDFRWRRDAADRDHTGC